MTTPGPRETPDRPTERPALGLSLAQVAGSTLAALTGAFAASWLGVTGTLTGVALGSVVGTVGSASYTYSLRRGHAVVRGGRVATAGSPAARLEWVRRVPWSRVVVAGAVAVVAGLLALTLVERVAGRPVSSLTTGSAATGTTLGRTVHQVVDGGPADPAPPQDTPPTLPGPTSSSSPTPSPSPSGSPGQSPSQSADPSGIPSPTPTGSTGPSVPASTGPATP